MNEILPIAKRETSIALETSRKVMTSTVILAESRNSGEKLIHRQNTEVTVPDLL